MKVNIVKPIGYCKGVENAILGALKIKEKHYHEHVVILGLLVHNFDAIKQLKDKNIDILYEKNKTYEDLLPLLKKNDVVILTAHGHNKKVEQYLNDNNFIYYDLTCPFVTLTHKAIITAINNKLDIIYIGRKNHPESIAATSLSNRVFLYDIDDGMNEYPTRNPLILSQTTFSNLDVEQIINNLKQKYPHAIINESICNSSNLRQKAIKDIPSTAKCIIVLGSNISNNTITLYNLAKSSHPRAKTYIISSANEIDEINFDGIDEIYLSSGASTPPDIIDEIKNKLLSIN